MVFRDEEHADYFGRDDEEVEVAVEIVWETAKGLKCSDGMDTFWLPKSQVIDKEEVKGGHKITIPRWLAEEKGVI